MLTIVHERRPPVPFQLIPLNDAVRRILEDERNNRRPHPHRRLKLLYVHQETSVAAGREDTPVGIQQLGANRTGECDSHAGKSVGDDAGVWTGAGVHPRDPEFVGAHIADQDIVATKNLTQIAHHSMSACALVTGASLRWFRTRRRRAGRLRSAVSGRSVFEKS